MECTGCGGDAGFNRVVLVRDDQRVEGALCAACERDRFGPATALHPDWQACARCAASSAYVVSSLEYLEVDDAGAVQDVEFVLDETAVGLCATHYREAFPGIVSTESDLPIQHAHE